MVEAPAFPAEDGVGRERWTLNTIAAILTISGSWLEKVRRTDSERISGRPLIDGSLLTSTTFWSARASWISSSFSTVGTLKMTPLKTVEERGREHEISLSASLVAFKRSSCCFTEEGKAQRSPPGMTSEFRIIPA